MLKRFNLLVFWGLIGLFLLWPGLAWAMDMDMDIKTEDKLLTGIGTLLKQDREAVSGHNSNGIAIFIKTGEVKSAPEAEKPGPLAVPEQSRLEQSTEAALSCLNKYKDTLKISSVREELRQVKETVEPTGFRHLKFRQFYQEVPLWGKDLWVHMDSENEVYLLEGRVEPTPVIDISPGLTGQQALEKVKNDLGGLSSYGQPELVIFRDGAGVQKLVYHLEAYKGFERWQYFIDAQKGALVEKYNDTQQRSAGGELATPGNSLHQTMLPEKGSAVTGAGRDLLDQQRDFSVWQMEEDYYLIDTSLPMQLVSPALPYELGKGNVVIYDFDDLDIFMWLFFGTLESEYIIKSDSPGGNWDPAGVSVLHNIKETNKYYLDKFNLNSYDGKGANILAAVHLGEELDNAFWNGSYIAYGDGGELFESLAKSLDVTAHELTHAVIEYTANLEYRDQSGALNEAMADIFACMVDRDDWTVGEDITKVAPGYLRNLSNPQEGLDYQPSSMEDYRKLPLDIDNGGVHINCGIPGRAAYLIAEGLTGENKGNSIGRDKTEQIFYRALTTHLTSQSDFLDCRRATMQSAEELYGPETPEVQAVKDAWDQVGVREPGDDEADPVLPGENVFFVASGLDQPYLGIKKAGEEAYILSAMPVSETPPAFTGNGKLVFFVDAQKTLWLASLSPEDAYLDIFAGVSSCRTIATSQDGRYLAYTTGDYDNKLQLIDLLDPLGESRSWDLSAGGEGSPVLLFADKLQFNGSGDKIIFDAMFKDVAGGECWNIGILDVNTGQTEFPVGDIEPGINYGNPAWANTLDQLVAADVIDKVNKKHRVITLNLATGQQGLVAEETLDEGTETVSFGKPAFSGKDNYLAIEKLQDVVVVPLTRNGDVLQGDMDRVVPLIKRGTMPGFFRETAGTGKLKVKRSVPDMNATGVPVDKLISITFNRDVLEGLAFNGITLKDPTDWPIDITKSILGSTVTITPMYSLCYDMEYKVTIPAGSVQDIKGNMLNQTFSLKFTTAGPPAEIKKLTVTPSKVTLRVEKTKELKVVATPFQGKPEDVTDTAEYQCSDPAVATVEMGVIRAIAKGKAEITVEYGGLSKKVKVYVK